MECRLNGNAEYKMWSARRIVRKRSTAAEQIAPVLWAISKIDMMSVSTSFRVR